MAASKQRADMPRSPGRPKGSPNKTTALLKDAILKAATDAGDGDLALYLQRQAVLNPGPFMSLLGKVLPLQVANPDGEAFRVVTTVELVAPDDD